MCDLNALRTLFAPAALAAADQAARIRGHAARVAREDAGDREPVRCWACPATIPNGSSPRLHGWHARRFLIALNGSVCGTMTELYCESCFSRWGWGEPERGDVEGAA